MRTDCDGIKIVVLPNRNSVDRNTPKDKTVNEVSETTPEHPYKGLNFEGWA